MNAIATIPLDWSGFWAWFLLFVRFTGLFYTLPGIGTDEVPHTFRVSMTLVISSVIALTGVIATLPNSLAEGGLMIATEFLLGYVLGVIPFYIVGALSVAGHVTAASIGLGQASLIDPSLGEHVSVLARLQSLVAITIFMLIDGHHTLIRAAADISTDVSLGLFRPGGSLVEILLERFSHSFELAVIVSGPILVSILVTQWVLGLLTKFVPQVNVFIVSLPLTIGLGLFVFAYTLPAMSELIVREFTSIDEVAARVMSSDGG